MPQAPEPANARQAFYLTTPIYYVNARPHIGHTYTTVVADAIARRERLLRGAESVWFLTGTDEHGQKIERSAAKANVPPQQFTDQVSAEFRALWDRMELSYNQYIRTTDEAHKRGVQKLFLELKARDFIYKGTYTGQYCVFDELYVDAPPGSPCPDCGRQTETVAEENYFFKLSAFERELVERIWVPDPAQPDARPGPGQFTIEPETRRNEVLSFIRSGLKDLSVSRTGFSWGIPVPGDERHVIYVWLDALANYITAVGYGSDLPEDQAKFEKFWPADLHIIGKEISRFHCVYWPAFLIAAGLPLPKAVVAHGWLLFEQSKMSKSRGNIVRSETILEVLGADALRYFLLREIVFGQDGSFSFDALVTRYNADLANGYGNLVSRTLAMIVKYFGGVVPDPGNLVNEGVRAGAVEAIALAGREFESCAFSRALEQVWALVGTVDGALTASAPWKQPEGSPAQAGILYTAAEAIRIVTALVYPILPEAAAKVWQQLGLGDIEKAELAQLQWGGLAPGTPLGQLAPIFPRADKDAITRMQDIEAQQAAARAAAENAAPTPAAQAEMAQTAAPAMRAPEAVFTPGLEEMEEAAFAGQLAPPPQIELGAPAEIVDPAIAPLPQISIDDFMKVELRVAQVVAAERVPKADKLLRLEVTLGYEQRQILAGLAQFYEPEKLIGRKVVIVANLAPRKLRGFESQGMVVAASLGEGTPALASFLEEVPVGARLK